MVMVDGVWAGCFQVVGPLSKELETKAHTDVQSYLLKQDNFIGA